MAKKPQPILPEHPPQKIKIVVDGNELEYIESNVVNKVNILYYKYSVSEFKLGLILPLPVEQLEGMIKNGIAVYI